MGPFLPRRREVGLNGSAADVRRERGVNYLKLNQEHGKMIKGLLIGAAIAIAANLIGSHQDVGLLDGIVEFMRAYNAATHRAADI